MSHFSWLQQPQRQHVAVLLVVPLIMAAINDDWLYTPIGYLDPWYNVGYFLHYADAAFRTAHYKIGRLSWLLPGWLFYHLFSPLVANIVLHIGALLISTVCLYLALARVTARDVAFFAALFLTIYFPFHGSAGWDYQTTGSGMFYALTVYCLAVSAQSIRPAAPLFASGVAFAATFHADIVFSNMVPVLAAQYVLMRRVAFQRLSWTVLAQAAWWTLAGFVMLTLTLCVINWAVGRPFFFFGPIVDIVFRYVLDPANESAWWSGWGTGWLVRQVGPWPAGAYYLAVPIATVLVGGWVLVRPSHQHGKSDSASTQRFLIGQYLLLVAIWAGWQSVGQTALQPDYFAYPLIIPCVMALAGIMSTSMSFADAPLGRTLILGSLLLGLVPGLDILGHLLPPSTLTAMDRLSWVIAFFLLAMALVAAMTCIRRRPVVVLALIAAFQIYFPPFMEAAYSYAGKGPFSAIRSRYSVTDQCALNRTAFGALIALDEFASSRGRPDHTWLWLGPQETATSPQGCFFNLVHLRLSAVSLGFNPLGTNKDNSAEDISDQQIAELSPEDWIAVVTTTPTVANKLAERIRQTGRYLGPLAQRKVLVGQTELYLQFLQLTGSPRS